MPFAICIVTTRTRPSSPWLTSSIIARGHLVGGDCSPCTQTILPICRFWVGCHCLANCFSWHRYSFDHHCQRWHTMSWQRCQWCNRGTGQNEFWESGMASRRPPMRKWPGVSTSVLSSGCGGGASGLEFRHASIWVETMVNSLNVRHTLPTLRQRWYLKLFTAASHRPL